MKRDDMIDELVNTFGRGIAEAILERGGEEPQLVAAGDTGRLFRWSDGTEVVETNGDPVWEGSDGFAELRAELR